MPGVIFIDNDQAVLKSVMRTYKLQSCSYDLYTISDAKMAFQKILTEDIKVIIADISLDDFECKTFYEELIAFDPSIIRISTTSDYPLMQSFNDNGQTHITFNKPINTSHLLDWLEKLFMFKDGSSKDLESYFFSSVKLKSYPENILNIMQMLNDENFEIDELCGAINNDTNLRVKLLKFINSSSFGYTRQVTDLKEAVEYLGVTNINNVIKYLNVFSIFEKHNSVSTINDTIPYLIDKKIISPAQSMDLTFIANLQSFITDNNADLDRDTINKTTASIMYVLMVDPEICEAVRFSSSPELCKMKNQILNILVLIGYLNGEQDLSEFIHTIYGKEKIESLKKGFNQ